MIINFDFENYLSYRDNTNFSLESGKRLRKLKNNTFDVRKSINTDKISLLKSAIVFGSNGSGKSNLIGALKLMKALIVNENNSSTNKIPKPSFLLDDYSDKKPTRFCIEIISNEIQYKYEFIYNRDKIIYESLHYFKNNDYYPYFEREGSVFNTVPNSLEQEVERTRSNLLFLKVAQNVNDTHSMNVYKWFSEKLIFIRENLNSNDIEQMLHVMEDPDSKKEIVEFLRKCDIKVFDLDTTSDRFNVPKEVLAFFENLKEQTNADSLSIESEIHKLNFIYKKYDETGKVIGNQRITFDNESEGTKKITTIAMNILDVKKSGCVFVMDEFDDSLHLNLSKILIQLFNLTENQSQFILTSHQLYLLDCDLRVDQIYLAKKEFDGISKLYSIFDFNDDYGKRRDLTIFKRYMQGVYGAIPDVDIEDFKPITKGKNQTHGEKDGKK